MDLIIPYQELLGNYNISRWEAAAGGIIPYQELLGNYNHVRAVCVFMSDYTIPRTVRELQPVASSLCAS